MRYEQNGEGLETDSQIEKGKSLLGRKERKKERESFDSFCRRQFKLDRKFEAVRRKLRAVRLSEIERQGRVERK